MSLQQLQMALKTIKIFYVEFHPEDIPCEPLGRIYSKECNDVMRTKVSIEQFTVAHSHPKTIGNIIAKAKLFQIHGRGGSKFLMGELNP